MCFHFPATLKMITILPGLNTHYLSEYVIKFMIMCRSCHILVLREQQIMNVSSLHRIMGIRIQRPPPNMTVTSDINSRHIKVVYKIIFTPNQQISNNAVNIFSYCNSSTNYDNFMTHTVTSCMVTYSHTILH
jgi:hypothetical protein